MSGDEKRRIARFNLNIIFLLVFYFCIIWALGLSVYNIDKLSIYSIFNCLIEIIIKVLVTFIGAFILMLINCFFFTNAFDK